MSRSADRSSRGEGFTLVEVVVALGIVMILMAALLPQLVAGIRATGTAKVVSQAKGVTAGQLDRMRNLPYHVAPAAGDYRDVLDFYYRNLTAGTAPTCTVSGKFVALATNTTGYVAPSGGRCAYEPAGAMYRSVTAIPPAAGSGGFSVVVDTQFLDGATPPQVVVPKAGYDTQATGKDGPASSQIGITLTVLYSNRGTTHPVTTYSQLYDQPTTATRTRGEVGITTLDLGSLTQGNGSGSLASGLLNLVGSLTYASTVAGNASAASAGFATGEQGSGASATVAAPDTTTASTRTGSAGWLLDDHCNLACWGNTRLDLPVISADGGLPNAGSAVSPVQSLVTSTGNNGISFGNTDNPSDYRRNDLALRSPLVQVDTSAVATGTGAAAGCAPGSTATAAYVAATGYVRTTGTAVEACGIARASSISLFPTDFAPRGVVQVELRRGVASCLVSGAAHAATASADYDAVVRYWNGSSYQVAGTITPGNATDPLAGVNLDTTSVDPGHVLGDYIASWSSLTSSKVVKTQITGLAEVKLPGVVTIASEPMRQDGSNVVDPTSVVSVTLGAVKCSALDQR